MCVDLSLETINDPTFAFCRNQSIGFQSTSVDWFVYENSIGRLLVNDYKQPNLYHKKTQKLLLLYFIYHEKLWIWLNFLAYTIYMLKLGMSTKSHP